MLKHRICLATRRNSRGRVPRDRNAATAAPLLQPSVAFHVETSSLCCYSTCPTYIPNGINCTAPREIGSTLRGRRPTEEIATGLSRFSYLRATAPKGSTPRMVGNSVAMFLFPIGPSSTTRKISYQIALHFATRSHT
jgi:hypothetical protein